RIEAATRVLDEAEALLGYRPRGFRSAEEALATEPGVEAADVCTEPSSHAEIVIPLLEAGIHVQVEKPLAVTIRTGAAILAAAERASGERAASRCRTSPLSAMTVTRPCSHSGAARRASGLWISAAPVSGSGSGRSTARPAPFQVRRTAPGSRRASSS